MSLPTPEAQASLPSGRARPHTLRTILDGASAVCALTLAVLVFLVPVTGSAAFAIRSLAVLVATGAVLRPLRGWATAGLGGDVKALREAEQRYRLLVEQMPSVTYIQPVGPESRMTYMSPRIEELLGLPPSHWTSPQGDRLGHIHPDDREWVRDLDLQTNETGDPFVVDYRGLRANGETVWIHNEANLVRDHEGRALFWQGVLFDMTPQKTAELQLKDAEAKYRALVEHTPAITYIEIVDEHDPMSMRTLYISPQVEAILGYTPEEWMLNPHLWVGALHPDDQVRMIDEDIRTNRTGEPFSSEYRIHRKNGALAWVHDECIAVRDDDGTIRFWQGVIFDVTEQRQAEGEVQRALEMERQATRRLRELDAMKTTFLHAVSHELRTPLAAILGFALTLEHQELNLPPEESIDMIKRLAANARKLDRLLSDLLDLDRLDRGIIEPKWRPTDVGALVRHAVEESDLMVERTLRIEADSIVVSIDPAKVERIVENLLANAARHTPPDTPVWVWVKAHREGVLIVVEDAGPGVAPEVRDVIFRPFEQGPDLASHSPGVGIGLSLVGRFAKLHGGRAWVEERPGGGASFRVYLPDGGEDGAGRPSGLDRASSTAWPAGDQDEEEPRAASG
jgi:PAS domain S-box-containing protein